ncbi:MAG: sporulation protein YqfD, partial [Clostridia bacterium]|nr:sporulation protein YqfD [Clostridia bacterium]
GFSERFINLCFNSGIHIWNISAENKEIKANIKPKDFKKLKDIRKKAGVRIKITEKRGLPFYLRRHRNRVGLLIAFAFFAVFMVVMNRFVWCIESTGSEKFSGEQILLVAEEMGLKYGTFVPFFDEREASRKIVNAFDGELLWASINIKGSKAVVEVRDFVKGIDENYNNEPCNIVSDSDGVVLSVEVSKGQSAIASGSAVSKGDLLISGVVDTKDMSASYCHAKGKVTALVKRNCTTFLVISDIFSFVIFIYG